MIEIRKVQRENKFIRNYYELTHCERKKLLYKNI